MRITFFGACREVTGSNFLLEVAGKKILLDCGIFQGSRLAEERNYADFPYNPAEIDFVILGHAHLDHTGRLPKLVKEGFHGRIFSTEPTKELAYLVLEDSQKLMAQEAKWDKHPSLYLPQDIEKVMELFQTINYHQPLEINSGIRLTFNNAGHILGSSITTIESEDKTLVYTSDLGNIPSFLLDPPDFIEKADFVICESTYGGRIHEDISKRTEKLANIINSTIVNNGVLIIPSFAIERTQELLHDIEHFCSIQGCEKPSFYLDSPLASKVTKVFKKYPEYLNKVLKKSHLQNDFFGLERFRITTSKDESKKIEYAPNPKIIIAGSGMMNGGRILYHAQNYLEDSQNTLLIVGYQSKKSLGRLLLEGVKEVKILGRKIKVNAQIKAIGSYSAHADQKQILDWISNIKNLKKVFLIHGEEDQATILSAKIASQFNVDSIVPKTGANYEL